MKTVGNIMLKNKATVTKNKYCIILPVNNYSNQILVAGNRIIAAQGWEKGK